MFARRRAGERAGLLLDDDEEERTKSYPRERVHELCRIFGDATTFSKERRYICPLCREDRE